MPAKITDAERARRRLHQQQKIAKARKVLGGGFALGTAFAIFKWVREFQEDKRRKQDNAAALQWARLERARMDPNFRRRLLEQVEHERKQMEERDNLERLRLANDPARIQRFNEQRLRDYQAFQQSRLREEQKFQEHVAAFQRYEEEELQYNLRRAVEVNAPRQAADLTRNAAEAKFVAEQKLILSPIDAQNNLPECYGPDPVSQEDVDLKSNSDAVAIIYERGDGQPLRAHCYERSNFKTWWAPGNLGSSSLYAYDSPQNRSDYQIFRLPNDLTYVTENSTKVILENPAKIFQRIHYKDVHTHKGIMKLYVLVPVPVVGH